MKKRIRINFNENNKAVQADTTIEYELDNQETENYINNQILQEAKELYEEAHAYAKKKTIQKNM